MTFQGEHQRGTAAESGQGLDERVLFRLRGSAQRALREQEHIEALARHAVTGFEDSPREPRGIERSALGHAAEDP